MHKISKRAKLYIANIISFICCIALTIFEWYAFYTYPPFVKYIFVQCAFTFLSLIVYYLSIIADAMAANVKDKKELKEKDEKQYKSMRYLDRLFLLFHLFSPNHSKYNNGL